MPKEAADMAGYRQSHFNFIYGNQALLACTIGFILYKTGNFFILRQRPAELFSPGNYFTRLLMPALPPAGLYVPLALLALLCCTWLLGHPRAYGLRLVLTFQLLWLHAAQWSYGVFSHVGHLLLLAHLFSVFIPFDLARDRQEARLIHKAISWYYAGLLFTYGLSGMWKWAGLVYKLMLKPGDIHWLHPDASLLTARISFQSYDLPFYLLPAFSWPWVWQAGFILVLLVQTGCIVAAFRLAWRPGVGIALIFFHLINAVFFLTSFVLAPLVIACLFFPYHALFRKTYARFFSGPGALARRPG